MQNALEQQTAQVKELLLLVNPKAGKAEVKQNLMEIVDILVKAGWRVVIRTTQYSGEVTDIIKAEGSRYSMVVCAGGDGTLNEAVRGLIDLAAQPMLGYIPAGTTNDFATSLALPKNNLLQAAEIVANGVPFCCDAGLFNLRPFVYVAAFGIFTEVSYSTPQQSKNVLGHAAYILEGLKSLADVKTHELVIVTDGEVISGEFLFGMVSNSISVGGFKMNSKSKIEMNDGLLEVVLVRKPRNPAELQGAVAALLRNEFTTLDEHRATCLYTFRTQKLQVFSKESVSWTLDGEYGGDLQSVTISVKPKAYHIMVQDITEEITIG
ncbi:MAG: YegS/Rv2252/BmrU family lipid kinase [Peptococcaceae bacterium]|nr:YegS/Rv2252/BmrU family lipid kinase [Peptococcaceae bacterium]